MRSSSGGGGSKTHTSYDENLGKILDLQGRRHQVLFGGGGDDSWAPKATYPQNLVSPRI